MMNEGCEKSRNCFGAYMMEAVIIHQSHVETLGKFFLK